MFTLKITHGEDTRRFPFAEVTWPALQQEVLKRFGIAPTPPFVLKYVDNEGDVLTVSNDGDLQEALSSAKQMSTSVIKFTLAFSDLPPNKGMEKEEEEEEERRRLELLKLQAEAEERRRVEEEMRLKEEEEKRKAEEEERKRLEAETEQRKRAEEEMRLKEEEERRRAEEERKRLEEEMRLKEEEERKKAEEEKKRFEQEMRLKEEEEKRRKAEEEEERRREKKREVERKFAEARRQLEEEERLKQQEEESKRIQFVQSPSSSSTSPALPANVMCDQCRQVVKGVFFHCGHCPDFDLCEACEKTPHRHSPDHLFIKIPFPIDQSTNPWLHHRILLPFVNPPASLQPQPQPSQPCPKPEPESKAQSEPSCLISSTESTTSSPFLCHFLRDVTIPDGTLLPPNTSFVKTWALKNKGSNNWPLGTRLVQIGSEGCPILGPKMIPVEAAFPGQELQVSVHLETPKELGRSSLRWRLETPEGLKFGHVLWVDVVVDSPLPEEEEPQEEEQEEQLQEQEQKKEEQEQEQLQEESLNNSSLSAPSSLILDFSDLTSSQQFYNEEMKALVSMGFCDRTNNLRLLRKHSGNLQLVLGDILQDPWFH